MTDSADPLPLARALIARASITPADDGAQDVLADALTALGFTVTRLRFGETDNLFARLGDGAGDGAPHVCFAGHTDVVPPGDLASWRHGPFAAEIVDGTLFGRGACDMKGAIAAFVAATAQHLAAYGRPAGSISLLITGDEEGPATDGTVRVLDWLATDGQTPDLCIVGEPTNQAALGDVIKIGRRGSLNARVTVHGTQGHVAYPRRADNPVHRLARIAASLADARLDDGTDWFEPSSLQLTSVDVGNVATNVIPASARAALNIRYNDRHTAASLETWLRGVVAQHAERFELTAISSGDAFMTEPGPMVDVMQAAIEEVTGRTPRLDTGGGTSDARFIAKYCPVAEFGLVGASMHQVDEAVPVDDIRALARIYAAMLRRWFA